MNQSQQHTSYVTQACWIVAAFGLLIGMAIQYPLQTTFPIGGDAVRHVTRAREVLTDPARVLSNSQYPASTAVLATATALPFSWPDRFVWAMALAHILTGAALGWLLWRVFGWQAAASGIALWALATTTITRHFEDATFAHLLALSISLLCLERFISGKLIGALLLFAIAGIFHPFVALLTAAVVLPTTALLWIPRLASSTPNWQKIVWTVGSVSIIVGAALWRGAFLFSIPHDDPTDLQHLLRTHIGPFITLAPFGIILLWHHLREHVRAAATLTWFMLIAGLFAFTHVGGFSPLPHRFDSAAIIAVIIGSSVALPWITRHLFSWPISKAVFVALIFVVAGSASWQASAFVYNFYESPSKYARPHPDEITAMTWAAQLPPGTHLAATNANRHSEWLPVLSGHTWTKLPEGSVAEVTANVTHLLFFHHRERVPESVSTWPIVYQNDGATIVAVPTGAQPTP